MVEPLKTPVTSDSHPTISPKVVIAPPEEAKQAHKQFVKDVEAMPDTINKETGQIKSERNRDQFHGGPFHGLICDHQPNGPRAKNDPNGYWADYFIKDRMKIGPEKSHVTGYHIYSTVRNIMGTDGHIAKGHANQWGLGTRTTNFRKCYYYIGFFDERIMMLEGTNVGDFTGVFSVS